MVQDNQPGKNQQSMPSIPSLPSNVPNRQEVLKSLFQDPYLKTVAKRVHKKTTAVPTVGRAARKSDAPATSAPQTTTATTSVKPEPVPSPTGQDSKKIIRPLAPTLTAASKPPLVAKPAEPMAAKSPGSTRKIIIQATDGQSLDEMVEHLTQSDPALKTDSTEQIAPKKPPAPAEPPKSMGSTRRIVIQATDGQSLDEMVEHLTQSDPALKAGGAEPATTKPHSYPATARRASSPVANQLPPPQHDEMVEENYLEMSDQQQSSRYLEIPKLSDACKPKESATKRQSLPPVPPSPTPTPPAQYSPPVSKEAKPEINKSERCMVVVPPDALEIALAGLEGQGVYDAMSAHASGINESNESDDDVNWVINTLSDKIAGTSSETFDSLVTNLQKEKRDISSLRNMQAAAPMSIAADIQQYAEQIGVACEDLYNAMSEEKITSVEHLYQAFQEMATPDCSMQTGEFGIFVKSLVHSFRDRKNEEALLGLIGVSADTGKQHLGTAYARLLAEIFRPELGGYFLQKTKNPNYNSFNLGNMIQHQLLELDEFSRVSYMENLLSLLKEKNLLLSTSREVANTSIRNAYFVNLFSDKEQILQLTEKYLGDLAIFKLSQIPHDQLPEDITVLVERDIYACLRYISAFPKTLIQKTSKIIYMLQKLGENDPLLFDKIV